MASKRSILSTYIVFQHKVSNMIVIITKTRTLLDLTLDTCVRARIYPFYLMHFEEEWRPRPVKNGIDAVDTEG